MSIGDDLELAPMFDDLRVGIALREPETGRLLDGNVRLAELYGYPLEDLREMRVEEYSAPSTRFTQAEAERRIQAAANGEPQEFEWQIERSNGELRWIRVELNQTTVDGVACVLAEVRDITEYQLRERRLRLLSRIIRHNLRNRTSVLMGHADRVKRAIEDETLEDEIETILDITNEVGTLSDSVRQIEEIAEPDATERSATDLCTVAQSVVADTRSEYDGVEVAVETPEPVWVVADQGVVYAVQHAVSNAIEHNDADTPSVTVSVIGDAPNDRGEIRIADNGPRIPEQEIDVLQEDIETTSTYHGTGVGLWVMQWCVDSLGGELTFDENEPRGNVVSITLPATQAPQSEE